MQSLCTFNTLRPATPTQLRHKSPSNSIQGSQTIFTDHNHSCSVYYIC